MVPGYFIKKKKKVGLAELVRQFLQCRQSLWGTPQAELDGKGSLTDS